MHQLCTLRDNCVADSNEAEKVAWHPYQFFNNDVEDNACDTGCPWQTATVLSSQPTTLHSINATLNISTDKELLKVICDGYKDDTWCTKLEQQLTASHN